MGNNPASGAPTDPPSSANPANPADREAELRRDVQALLESATGKDGIDESCAKRLRKAWAQYQDNGGADDSLAALFAELRERIHAQVELREKQFAQVEAQMQQLRAGVKDGDLKQSRKLEKSTINLLNGIAGLSSLRRQKIITELEALRPEIQKMSAWQRFGTIQAREKMISEIKEIHSSGESLDKIAQRIQEARKEWREWDKAGQGVSKKLHEIFDRECTKAYLPCQEHFDKQKQQRRQNSEAREQICASLEQAFEDVEWRNPNWKELQQLVRSHTTKWRNAGPADYHLRKTLQQRFDAVMEKLTEPMERERRRNYKIREQLIEEVEQLAQREDTRSALAEMQALKKKWAPTVTSKRSREREIWKRFTDACDKVAGKRDRERADFAHTLKENLAAREALCAEIETFARGETQTDAHPAQWQTRWEQLGEAPKASAAKVEKRYQNALAQAKKTLASADLEAEINLQNRLKEKSLLCADIEALAVAGTGDVDDAREAALQDFRKRWEALESLPDDLEPVIGERYQLACAAVADQAALKQLRDSLAANLERAHALLLQLEILTEVDSPAEFSRQRMALQIERLSAAMGKGGADWDKSAGQLIRDILLVGAVGADSGEHAALFARLDRCLVKQGED